MTTSQVGAPRPRADTPAKARGATRYAADHPIRGLLHARLVLAPRAHARILSIERDDAMAVPGVVAVLIAADLPLVGEVSDRINRPLARSEVVFAGEPVALVVARTPEAAADGAELVTVCLEPLPVVVDSEAAMDPAASRPGGPAGEATSVEVPAPDGPLGAKGIGEAPVIAGAAAVANAVAAATGVRLRELPMTRSRVWRAMNDGSAGDSPGTRGAAG